MGDERLRALERRWRETGAAADEAAWLVERVRAGELPAERLELAAFLEHEAALLAHGPAADPGHGCWFANLLHRHGAGPTIEAAAAIAELCLPTWERLLPGDPRPRRRVEVAREWAARPEISDAAAEALHRVDEELELAYLGRPWPVPGDDGFWLRVATQELATCVEWAAGGAWPHVLASCRRLLEQAARTTGREPLELRREAGLVAARRALC